MKTRVVNKRYEDVIAMPKEKPFKPWRQHVFFRMLMKTLSAFDLKAVNFQYEKIHMELLKEDEPCLVLMNHSSFIDLEIAATLLSSRKFNIVATSDSFVGIMKWVMYPEASYSFDGTATPLPDSIGRCIKMLGVPVVMIRTYGAYTRQPLYNCLRKRKVDVSAEMKYLLSAEQVKTMGANQIQEMVKEEFSFDNFKWQQENEVCVDDPERAEGLNRVLYKCPNCKTEGKMVGERNNLICRECGKQYELTEYGYMHALDGDTEFDHIPDWYRWERDCVREEIENNTYLLDVPVDICMMVNMKAIYRVGEGNLKHTVDGFHLTGCDGQLDYRQKPSASYSLYSDYFWYEIGDVICIGDNKVLYYCFPKIEKDIVAKTRLATEEMYKLARQNRTGEGYHGV